MEIRFANPEQTADALRIAEHEYHVRGYVKALGALDGDDTVVLVAIGDDQTVVGTASLVRATHHAPPTLGYFGLDPARPPIPGYHPAVAMEIGRLAARRHPRHAEAVCGLLAGLQLWGDAHAVHLGVASLKPRLRANLTRLGVASTPIAGPDQLVPAAIPSQYHGYFFPADPAERPSAYAIDLNLSRSGVLSLPPYTKGLVTIAPDIVHPRVPAA